MKNKMRRLMICLAGTMAFSLNTGMLAMAEEDTTEEVTETSSEEESEWETEDDFEGVDGNKRFAIPISDMTDEKWDKLAMTNDDKVETGINIRDEANEEGTVMACIYRGGAVEVLDKGETWTEVKSGIVVGYIKNEYLTYGTDIKDMVDHYGIDGVEANWDDVHVFAEPDANAEIIHIANAGDVFTMVEDQGHWLTIKLDGKLFEDEVTEDGEVIKAEDRLAYVSIEDVTKVVLVDEAVPMEEYFSESEHEETEDEYADTSSGSDNSSYTDGSSGTGSYSYTPTPSTPAPSTGGSTGASGSNTDTTTTTDNTDDDNDDYEEDDGGDDTYYDDGSYDSYDDGEDVEEVDDAEEYTDDAAASYTEDYTYSEDYAENYSETYTESYTEYYTESYTEDYTATSEDYSYTGSDDLDLLAAIIYCEAGNQSYEGMVAVGAVVMNRVNSSSFPNTISEVIYQSGQFTPAYSGTLTSALANGVPSACYEAASAAINGENPVGGALYFNTGSGLGVKIGAHQFF